MTWVEKTAALLGWEGKELENLLTGAGYRAGTGGQGRITDGNAAR